MTSTTKAIHHLHARKRNSSKLHPFPSKKPLFRSMDSLAYVAGILTPVFAIPQLIEIYMKHSAAGVSLVSWLAYLFLSVFWMSYGILHKEKPIMIMYSSQALLQVFIVAGIVIY